MVCFWNWLGKNSLEVQAIASSLQFIVIVVLIIALFVAIREMKTGISQTQGNTIGHIAATSRELFMKVIEDKDLEILIDASATVQKPEKVNLFIGVLIQHLANAYYQYKLKNIPEYFWKNVLNDAKDFLKRPEVAKRWHQVSTHYEDEFKEFINTLIGSKGGEEE